MSGTVLRGLGIAVFFGIVLAIAIPNYVPEPAFIPGFALAPDFWPEVISIAGLVFGLIAAGTTLAGQVQPVLPSEVAEDSTPCGTAVWRLLMLVAALVGFVVLADIVGFLLASIVLTAVAILLTGERRLLSWGLALAVLMPAALYLFFTDALGTQFPSGLLFD